MADVEPARLRRLPFVVLDSDPGPDVNSVRVDARGGGFAAARQLLGLGHRRFAVMSFLRDFGPPRFYAPGRSRPADAAGMEIDQDKLLGYADALAEAGIAIDDVPMVGPPLGARRRTANSRRGARSDGDLVDVGDAGDRGDGRGATARPHRAARPLRDRL